MLSNSAFSSTTMIRTQKAAKNQPTGIDYQKLWNGVLRMSQTWVTVEKEVGSWFWGDSLNFSILVSVHYAMKNHSLNGLSGVIIGSMKPWVEVLALQNGQSLFRIISS